MTILYFAQTRQIAGVASEKLEIDCPIAADALWTLLLTRHPGLGAVKASTRLARNGTFAAAGEIFLSEDEVALIPPVSGG